MKRYAMIAVALLFCSFLFSFSGKWGGDVFAVFLNGKQVHQQAVYADKSVKTLTLPAGRASDRIEMYYSHCGKPGHNRVITVRNEKNGLIRKLTFGNGKDHHSLMGFTRKELGAKDTERLRLYYSSDELPQEKLLAILDWENNRAVTKL